MLSPPAWLVSPFYTDNAEVNNNEGQMTTIL